MSHAPSTSVSLILRVASQNDVEAWEQFVEIYQPLVYRIAVARGFQDADAHDLVQEVMSRVARSVSGWDPNAEQGTFRGWISRIARNLVIDFLRHKKHLPQTGDHSEIIRMVESRVEETPESNYFDLEHEKQLFGYAADQIRDQFQPTTWQAFWRTAVQQESIQEVGCDLGLTRGAVYIARCRVMAKLKETVQQLQRQQT